MCVCVPVLVHIHAHRDQKRVLDPLELELQVVVNHPKWKLESEPGSSARAVSALDTYHVSIYHESFLESISLLVARDTLRVGGQYLGACKKGL